MSSFAAYELSKADFGDKRLTKRIVKMVEGLSRNPEKTIPQNLSSWGDIKGCYRFMSNDKVTPEKVHNAHRQSTLSRIENYETVLLIQDTTSIDYSSHEQTKGLGYLERKYLSGILLHSTLALSIEGLPLGILTQQMWERPMEQYGKKHKRSKLPIEEKESYRWLSHRKESNELIPNHTHRIHIADQECDICDFLNMVRSEKEDYIIRMRHNRKLDIDGQKIKETMDRAMQRFKLIVEVGRSNKRKPRRA